MSAHKLTIMVHFPTHRFSPVTHALTLSTKLSLIIADNSQFLMTCILLEVARVMWIKVVCFMTALCGARLDSGKDDWPDCLHP